MVYGYYTAINAPKLFKNPTLPKTQKEGWFGTNTNNLGVDKFSHCSSTYIASEILHAHLGRKTSDAPGIALTSAALTSGVMLWAELYDSIEPDSGWSWEDVALNSMGAGFSVLRNSVTRAGSETRLSADDRPQREYLQPLGQEAL